MLADLFLVLCRWAALYVVIGGIFAGTSFAHDKRGTLKTRHLLLILIGWPAMLYLALSDLCFWTPLRRVQARRRREAALMDRIRREREAADAKAEQQARREVENDLAAWMRRGS